MEIRSEQQLHPVADEVSAITAVVRPILSGILFALKEDVVAEVGGRNQVKLKMLPRLRRPGDGDTGICFEYAAHDAVRREEPRVVERVYDALSTCSVPGQEVGSILFGAEKQGSQQLIDTGAALLEGPHAPEPCLRRASAPLSPQRAPVRSLRSLTGSR